MANPFRLALIPASLLALSACATAAPPAGPGAQAHAAPGASESSTVYGYYLAGQVAAVSGDSQAAADFLDKARAADPTAVFVKAQLFTTTLLAGDQLDHPVAGGGHGEGVLPAAHGRRDPRPQELGRGGIDGGGVG